MASAPELTAFLNFISLTANALLSNKIAQQNLTTCVAF